MRYRGAALVTALAGAFAYAAVSAAQGDASTICVAAPYADGSSAALGAPLRDALVDGLRALKPQVVALDAGYDGALAEAATKNCSNIVLTKVQDRTGGGGRFGMVNKYLRGRGQDSPPWTPTPSGGASQTTSLATVEQQAIHRGEAVTLEYQLTPGRALTPIKSGKLEAKAGADGEDVLGPLVSQVAAAVAGAAGAEPTATTAPPAAKPSADARGSKSNAQKNAAAQNIDCEQVARQSHGSVTVQACQQMMAAQHAMDAAANDPSASRPGDDKLSCDQIAAEMKQQQFAKVDKAKVAEAQAATTDFQQKTAEEQKKRDELAAKESAEMSIASKIAPTNAAGVANQKKIDAEQKAANEQTEKELAPKAQRMMSANAAIIGDVGNQLAANPRLARLVQLANDKKCKLQ